MCWPVSAATSPPCSSARNRFSLSAFMSYTRDRVGSAFTRAAYRITKKMPIASPTIRITSRPTIPSLSGIPANPDAIPVANGLIVDPSVPIPHPRSTIAAPVIASYPAAIITVITSA